MAGNNTSWTPCDHPQATSQDEGAAMANFHLTMGLWLPACVCCLGIIGNALSLMVLSHDRSKCVTFVSLRALASSDILLLLGAFVQQVIPLYCNQTGNTGAFCRYQGYVRVYAWPVVCIAQTSSIWLTLLISTERYVAICHPLRTARMCNNNRIRMCIAAILVFSLLFNLPRFFEFQALRSDCYQLSSDPQANLTWIVLKGTALRDNHVYRYLYNTVLFFIVIYAFPMVTLTILNIRLVVEIKRAKRNWEMLNRSRKKEMQASVLPLVIVLVYFLCGTQSLIAFMLDAIFVAFHDWLQIYTAIVNLLVIVNSAVNFILMYIFGRKFRNILKGLMPCNNVERRSSIISRTYNSLYQSGRTSM